MTSHSIDIGNANTLSHKLPSRRIAVCCAVAIGAALLNACQKSDQSSLTTEERLKAVQQKQETSPNFYVERKSVDYMADLKNLRDATKTEKADAKADPVATRAEAAKAAQAVAEAQKQAAAVPVPTTPQPAPARPVEQAPAPVQPAPAPAPVVAAPAPRPAADTATTLLNRENPEFPREAIRQGVENGVVRARLSINAAGEVTSVTIVTARPARVFDRGVQTALQRWKFNPGADGRSFETEINFQR